MRKNSKGFAQVLVVILLLILLGGVIYYLGRQKEKVSVRVNPTPTTPVESVNPTANWKTYASEKYGYSVKYPSDWGIVDVSGGTGDGIYIAPQVNVDQINKMKMYPDNIGKNFVSLIDIAEGYVHPTDLGPYWKNSKIETLNVGGVTAKKYVDINIKDTPNGVFFKGDVDIEVLIPLKDNLVLSYTLMDDRYASTFDQILSTFKFTD